MANTKYTNDNTRGICYMHSMRFNYLAKIGMKRALNQIRLLQKKDCEKEI